MASTYSTNLKIELIGSGSQAGTWGDTTNVNLGVTLEEAITGRAAVEFFADDDLTLTAVNLNTTQPFRHLLLDVTSTVVLTEERDLIVPAITKQYIVWNQTTGGQALTVRTSAGTGVSVLPGERAHLFVNGVDVEHAITSVNGTAVPSTGQLLAW